MNPSGESSKSNYENLYKYNGVVENQETRRNKKLEELKKRRNDAVDELRNLTDIFGKGESMEVQTDTIPLKEKGRNKFKVKLMLSEWMVDIPIDLDESWYYKVCPKGVRNLVIAKAGVTKVYNRLNQLKGTFQTTLPGGGIETANHRITLLDCVYRNQDKTFYVLDILAWNSMSLINCSAEFRFYFLQSKFNEEEFRGGADNKRFKAIPHQFATRDNISVSFSDQYYLEDETPLPVDGILFYHKDSIYTPGLTPLVGWLKPYMLTEKLDVLINDLYLLTKPKSYTNLENYLKYKENKIKKNRNLKGSGDMEVEDEVDKMEN
ncbi:snurportin-1 isoform X2 [Onthophagus taurus]|uniref:snurportin-1 isoform X2 n=1 Tax=Onthophagus taurus TaxID=166361 RepID=UPI000C20E59A|nr:snurportin-1 isoform X2 [Onthophagus taurus]